MFSPLDRRPSYARNGIDDGSITPLVWVAAGKKDFLAFPKEVVHAQCGDKPANAKPPKGFSAAGVMEVVENHDGDTFRAVYPVRFEDAAYVPHCFQKSGIATPRQDVDLVRNRLQAAEEERKRWLENF